MTYLDKPEVEALLSAFDRATVSGQRNYAVLLFLYNSGARASEAANLRVSDLDLGKAPHSTPSVYIVGKGNKARRCPLWKKTAVELQLLVDGCPPNAPVFLNRKKEPLTRFGVYNLVKIAATRAGKHMPSLVSKQISPHSLRHATATHLLRAGVDMNTIRAWLGHVSLDTTQIYAEVDLEMKARALAKCETPETLRPTVASEGALMEFLRTL